ncbi:unnamed protein product [Cuscuta epithymum]|uniref:tRNA ligase phosphodiesterase domain-containing protein n=1 Tax=Cuscuta epithymum TaxID=186058 RepID=A0AAV0F402_9ASTE|nr:unnamed protein product [Cuscuta epithymum]
MNVGVASQRIIFGLTVSLYSRSSSPAPASLYSRTFIFIRSRSLTFSSSLFYPPMSSHRQKRGGFREQRWQPKVTSSVMPGQSSKMEPVSAAALEDVTTGIKSLDITGKSKQHGVPQVHLQAGGIGVMNKTPAHNQKAGVWKQKSYGKVSGSDAVEVENASTSQASAEVRVNVANKPSHEKNNASLNNLLENFTVDKSTFAQAQVRATFYPKFENEKSDQEMRARMIEMVTKGLATVEVSLKHSGSLFMYAGNEGGAYAKNSFGNIYTAVGVFVLGRMLKEAWGPLASSKQQEFNKYLEQQRMCISMELVTAVLGDHGQRPREDYVVVTAVTKLGNGKPKFYSTPDIIAFCRKWRLPTNHVWLFSTRKSVTSFFAAYDALCEEGTATSVCNALDEVADISIPGSKDHMKVQGEILEGLVARIVSRESSEHLEQVLRDFPLPPVEGAVQDLGPTLREICAENRSDEKQQIKALLDGTGAAFCPNHLDWFGNETSDSHSRTADRSVVSKFLKAHPADYSTTKFQEVVRLIRERHQRVSFKCFHNFHKTNDVSSDNLHFKMVIHVFNDSVFRQYQKEMRKNPGLWPLYRGFFVDLNLFKADGETAADILKGKSHIVKGDDEKNSLADEDANLMVKLKFLTYKLRTFLIRNGLQTLFKKGAMAYKTYYLRQMQIWNTSAAKQQALSKMLDEWAVYILRKYGNKQLSTSIYLSEAEPFLEQYAKRSPQNQALIGSAGSFVRSEDFLAIVDGGDEEGDLEQEKDVPPVGHSISSADTVMKDEGLIVFFPGIPGCAKSALCKEILSAPGSLGDDRPVRSLMGDLIKGKYWQKVADARRAKPYSITLADKNAPNEEVWAQIEDMCRSTKASAVPVVPDSEGTETNPFSLDALAVFIFRVLHRVNHPGNLDKSSPVVGYVLLMFYNLYDGKSREEFETDLIGRFGSLVKIPLLKPERPPLPHSVKSILEEGMKLYNLHTSRHRRLEPTKGTYAKEWAKWEKQLRDVLYANADYLNSIQVPFELAVEQVLGQLRSIVRGETRPIEKRKLGSVGTIVFAAISLPVKEIKALLENVAKKDSEAEAFLKDKDLETRLQKAHVTLAHKGSHSVAALASYAPFLHQQVPVEMTALLYSERVAAIEASIGSIDGEKICSKNKWAHTTLWTAKGVAPVEANSLPQLLEAGMAKRVEINPPVTINGVVQFS